MTNRIKGNILVAIQFALLGLLFLVPGRRDWVVAPELASVGLAVSVAAAAMLIFSAINLGKSLTANPVPLETATLKTNGLYSIVRHPIYFAVLLLAAVAVMQSRSFMHIVFGVALFVLFEFKARFEEQLLMQRYAHYKNYAARVGRLIPFVGRIR